MGSSQALFEIKKKIQFSLPFLATLIYWILPKMSRSNLECIRSSESEILSFLKFPLIGKMSKSGEKHYLLEIMSNINEIIAKLGAFFILQDFAEHFIGLLSFNPHNTFIS